MHYSHVISMQVLYRTRMQCFEPFMMGNCESLMVTEIDQFEIGMINCGPSLKTITPISSSNCKLDSSEMVAATIKVPDIIQPCPVQLIILPSSQLVTGKVTIPSVLLKTIVV